MSALDLYSLFIGRFSQSSLHVTLEGLLTGSLAVCDWKVLHLCMDEYVLSYPMEGVFSSIQEDNFPTSDEINSEVSFFLHSFRDERMQQFMATMNHYFSRNARENWKEAGRQLKPTAPQPQRCVSDQDIHIEISNELSHRTTAFCIISNAHE